MERLHYVDKRIAASDKDRDEFLKNLGWKVFRIRWANYQKLNLNEKRKIVEQIVELLDQHPLAKW